MLLIQTKDLVKAYGEGVQEVRALDGVSLDIEQGDFVAIIGASGSGKSTFMNMIGCLDQPSSGSYILGGQLVSSLTADELAMVRNQRIGFVFQQFNLLARTTALDNVAMPLLYAREGTFAGLSKKEQQAHATERLIQVGLGERLHHTPSELSGGQQQRVAIARALVNNPALILADEPTSSLDDEHAQRVITLLKSEAAKIGAALVIVTHDQRVKSEVSQVLELKSA